MGHRSPRFRVSLLALLAALGVAGAGGGTAAGAVVGCGDTLTKSTTLTNDVTGCPGDGVHIGADGITLNLNGHTIGASDPTADSSKGIDFAGHGGVTVTHGTVKGFVFDVWVDSAGNRLETLVTHASLKTFSGIEIQGDRNTVSHATQTGISDQNGRRSSTGIEAQGARNSIGANTATGASTGVILLGDGCSVTYSSADGNDTGFDSTCTVSHNTATGNVTGFQVAGASSFTSNTATGNGAGFTIFASGATVQGNVSNGNEVGFEDVDSGGNLIKANRAQSNGDTGFLLEHTFGERLVNNVAGSENPNAGGAGGNAFGIEIVGLSQAPADQNVLDGNSVNWNTSGGIGLGPNVFDTTVINDIANRNGGDGMSLNGGGLVKSDTARYNQGFGIRASGMTDGGNNHAAGNGLGQCQGVSCAP